MHSKKPQNIASFNSDLPSVLKEIEEGQYLIIVADLKKAYIFLFHNGELKAFKSIMDTGVSKRSKINSGELYGRNTKQEHHIDNQIHRHIQLIVQEAVLLIGSKHISGLFLGGHKPLFHRIVAELPSNLHEKLRGEIITELNIPQEELIKHCQNALKEYIG